MYICMFVYIKKKSKSTGVCEQVCVCVRARALSHVCICTLSGQQSGNISLIKWHLTRNLKEVSQTCRIWRKNILGKGIASSKVWYMPLIGRWLVKIKCGSQEYKICTRRQNTWQNTMSLIKNWSKWHKDVSKIHC